MIGRIRDHVEIIPQASKPETWISLSSRDRVDPKFESWLGHRQLYNFKLNEMKAITETFCPGVKYVKYSGKINTIYLEIIHCWISHYISRNITESKWQKIMQNIYVDISQIISHKSIIFHFWNHKMYLVLYLSISHISRISHQDRMFEH